MQSRSSRHDRASAYARSGLFKGLGSFADLESRIERLPTEQERGAAFEVFVEAYLSTDEIAQAEEVWVGGKVPAEVRRRLNLPARDYGYDGVYRTRLNELVTYQAKFRSGRTSLPYAELATFFGISEKADRRVILTNSIAISAVAESRTAFQTTRGGDFDRLDAAQLAAIAAWVEGIPPAPQIRGPRPHQKAALADIERELSDHDRATVVMACGTGKTLVALWAAEEAQPKRVLVLVPSLNLLRQTLHEWAKWTNWGERFRYLCVCSDPKVAKGIDEIEIRPEDANFPVRTDPAIVARFLDEGGDAVSAVFCTYQSAPVVSEAMKGREPFDLGIFDEAHKTTGREGTRYAFALKDKNLPIRKRLFLTATPRHYDIRKRNKDGDFAVASMDNEEIYGRVAHRLTFAQAAEQNIIVPYKVVISVVDSDMIDNALLDQSEVEIEGDPVRAKWVAHQIALKRAVEEHALKRIITFHSSIKAAAAFASDESEGVGVHLPDFQRFHVSGVQPTAERDEHMREFVRVQRGVITNARCLTEGVDVPSVDMVAFMNPRRSHVDIVQAVGRAMRTAGPDKTCGYVLVPLFLEMRKDETLTEALERSDFDEIAQVLNAMRENDGGLNDIIQALMVDRGRTGGFDESRLRDKVDVLGPQIQLDALSAAIRARTVAELGNTWDEWFGVLIRYKERERNCCVPRFHIENLLKLGDWVHSQRSKRQSMSDERRQKLDALGFEWDPLAADWEEGFEALVRFKERAHHVRIQKRHVEGGFKLGSWVSDQRKKASEMSGDRRQRLTAIGFDWDPHTTDWENGFVALEKFKERKAHCRVPARHVENGFRLGTWVSVRRSEGQTMPADRRKRLDAIGFEWDPLAADWEEGFAALTKFKERERHCRVPPGHVEEGFRLGTWVANLRWNGKGGNMAPDRRQQLDAIGFDWDPYSTSWKTGFAALEKFKEREHHCRVPNKHVEEGFKLGSWVADQRKKGDAIPADRRHRLDAIGFEWDVNSIKWEKGFAALEQFKEREHHCRVLPGRIENGFRLGNWIGHLRHHKDDLSTERRQRLDAIGFDWDPNAIDWEDGFTALKKFEEREQHCRVPQTHVENGFKLGVWVSNKRRARHTMSVERRQRLDAIGFVWSKK